MMCAYFKAHFIKVLVHQDPDLLTKISRMVSNEVDADLCFPLIHVALRSALLAIEPDCAAGPDGFNGGFYRSCCSIIKEDLVEAGNAFIEGLYFTKAISNTLLALIPKILNPATFTVYRPIRLCTFFNKLISKVLSSWMTKLLTSLILEEQSRFVKNRDITENILLVRSWSLV